jgi:hypothetical protein
MAYHTTTIAKGTLGELSKIREEFEELQDGVVQDNKVLQICELCDLVGAIEAFASNKFNLNLDDLIKMMKLTKSAFQDGSRK